MSAAEEGPLLRDWFHDGHPRGLGRVVSHDDPRPRLQGKLLRLGEELGRSRPVRLTALPTHVEPDRQLTFDAPAALDLPLFAGLLHPHHGSLHRGAVL